MFRSSSIYIPLSRRVCDWVRAVILRKTATPYECWWRDRAQEAQRRFEEAAQGRDVWRRTAITAAKERDALRMALDETEAALGQLTARVHNQVSRGDVTG